MVERWDGKRGGIKREETYVYLWLIHIVIWQKPTQYCKTIILQLKINGITSGKESACQCKRHEGIRFDLWVRKIPWSRKHHHTPELKAKVCGTAKS